MNRRKRQILRKLVAVHARRWVKAETGLYHRPILPNPADRKQARDEFTTISSRNP